MNQRIRELWAQCVIKHTKTPMNWQNVADEFAELIVKECVGRVRYCIQNDLDYIAEDIEQHFGVEE